MKRNTVLTIAGSDCSGGAGIQADIKTMTVNGVYAMSVITALTAQNTIGVSKVMPVSADFVKEQLEMTLSDIMADSVKIGMAGDPEVIGVIGHMMKKYKIKNIVTDPVMVSTSGARLISPEAVESIKKILFPVSTVITPNIPEAEVISNMVISSKDGMERAAEKIFDTYGCAVLVKGGHAVEDADDYLYDRKGGRWFRGQRIDNPNTHGTGCTLSSAIASWLARGKSLDESVAAAKKYLEEALRLNLDLGRGSGPMDHGLGGKDFGV